MATQHQPRYGQTRTATRFPTLVLRTPNLKLLVDQARRTHHHILPASRGILALKTADDEYPLEHQEPPHLPPTPVTECRNTKALQQAVIHLYDLLDKIDTADDIAKTNDQLYREIVQRTQRKKNESGVHSPDGYSLVIDANRQKNQATEISGG